ncbi:hydrogenase maturation nickel metallochaperone HypA [Pontibacter ruber]|uniref:Hydrogenase maturation factor HypA n=1 Tax=Pontibacter ruber TaxID=1343895 RepID=A0ABW5D0S8_9BACT|nr:hydrogenase maturation nickel metallochaperone HypA [Pontibacter ruber]
MHELSIALSIVEIAEEEVKKAGGTQVEQIVLEIGSLASIEEEALAFAWQEAVKQTVLEKAIYVIQNTAGRAVCLACKREFELSFMYDLCPFCGDFRKELMQGKELRIKSLIII